MISHVIFYHVNFLFVCVFIFFFVCVEEKEIVFFFILWHCVLCVVYLCAGLVADLLVVSFKLLTDTASLSR